MESFGFAPGEVDPDKIIKALRKIIDTLNEENKGLKEEINRILEQQQAAILKGINESTGGEYFRQLNEDRIARQIAYQKAHDKVLEAYRFLGLAAEGIL